MKPIICPSVLTVKRNRIPRKIKEVEKLGISWIHFDVMDGKFVEQSTFSVEEIAKYCKKSKSINDVHLMINEPRKHIKDYAKAGANYLTFHFEAVDSADEINAIIDEIHANNMKAGISVKPNTEVSKIYPFLNKIDMVLIMTVEPGKGRQKLIGKTIDKIKELKTYLDENKLTNVLIEVDGGINDETFKACYEAGANVFVCGSFIFDTDNIQERLDKLNV